MSQDASGQGPMATLSAIQARQRHNLELRQPLSARRGVLLRSMRRARKADTAERLREEFNRLDEELAILEEEFSALTDELTAEVRRLTTSLQAAMRECRL